jgi:hypothetical protein
MNFSKTSMLLAMAGMPAMVSGSLFGNNKNCVTIQSGTLMDDSGDSVKLGYDKWGYNYQAHMFNGKLCDAFHNDEWCQELKDIDLVMKWNDALWSNKDCDKDFILDHHFGYASYRGSGAWQSEHYSGVYENEEGGTCKWTQFDKVIAVPSDAVLIGGIWYALDGTEIGLEAGPPEIWGEFAIIQIVYNDPCAGYNGLAYKGVRPGLGNW